MSSETDKREIRTQQRDRIEAIAFDSTRNAIHTRIDEERHNIRENIGEDGKSGGFFGFIKMLFFKLAEFIDSLFDTNLVGFIANMTGNPIPDNAQIQHFSGRVSQSISNAMIPEDQELRNQVAGMNDSEFAAHVQKSVRRDLTDYIQQNPDSPFAGSIDEIAEKAGQNAKENHASIQQLLNFDQQIANGLKANIKDKERADIGRLTGLGDRPINNDHLNAFATVTSSTIQRLTLDENEQANLAGAEDPYAYVSGQIETAIRNGRIYIQNSGGANGPRMTLSDEAIRVAANEFAEKITPTILLAQGLDDPGLSNAFRERQLSSRAAAATVMVDTTIKTQAEFSLREGAALATLETYNDIEKKPNGLFDRSVNDRLLVTAFSSQATVLNQYYEEIPIEDHAVLPDGSPRYRRKEGKPLTAEQEAEINDAINGIYTILEGKDRVLGEKQRGKTSHLISEAIVEVLNGQDINGMNDMELGKAVEKAVSEKLTNESAAIDAAAIPKPRMLSMLRGEYKVDIATINANNIEDNPSFDLIGKIAGSIGNAIERNEGGMADQLRAAGAEIRGPVNERTRADAQTVVDGKNRYPVTERTEIAMAPTIRGLDANSTGRTV